MNAKITPSITNKGQFTTYDIGLATALFTLGYGLVDIDKTNFKKCKFVFCSDEHLEKMVNQYWDNTLTLQARSLIDNQKMLKNRLYSV